MFDSLRTFALVARLESFSAAARTLKCSPSSVSRQMDKLEDELQTQLLVRSPHQVSVTAIGAQLAARADALLAHADEVLQSVRPTMVVPEGPLRISAVESFGRRYLCPLLAGFLQTHPRVDLYFELDNRLISLQDEGIDVAVRIGRPQDSSLKARLLAPMQMVVAAAPHYLATHGTPRQPEDLAGHNCLTLDRHRQRIWWHFRRGSERARVSVRGSLSSAGGEPLIAAAASGLGVVLLADWMLRDELAAGTLVPLLEDWQAALHEDGSGGVYAVFPSTRYEKPALRAWLQHIDNHLPALLHRAPRLRPPESPAAAAT